MNFTILGSGGCVSTPRPLCTCSVCEQARRLGPPYARCGCCLYIEDAQAIVDTPEDVCAALNRGGVRAVNRILYSHADPDHTMGMRVLEQLRLDWLAESTGSRMKEPIEVVALPRVVDDLRAQATCYGSMLAYYEQKGLARLNACTQVQMDGVRATLVPVDETGRVTVFVFEQAGRRLVYAPCDVKPFPSSPLFEGADCLVVGQHGHRRRAEGRVRARRGKSAQAGAVHAGGNRAPQGAASDSRRRHDASGRGLG